MCGPSPQTGLSSTAYDNRLVQDTFIFSCRAPPGAAWLHPRASKHGRPVVGRQPNDTNNGAVLLGNQDDVVGPNLAAALPALVNRRIRGRSSSVARCTVTVRIEVCERF